MMRIAVLRSRSWVGLGLAWVAAGFGATARADEVAPEGLRVVPGRVVLRGPDAARQLIVEGPGDRDLTGEATYGTSDPAVATVDPAGTVRARGDGAATITVRVGSAEQTIPVAVGAVAEPPPIDFANGIVPIFTRYGCNAGGCHGKASGQNGFRLSLLGFEPELDYETLVKEGRGRRLFPAAPEQSLLLTKAVAKVPHGGGRRLEPGSHEYRLIARWIGSGMPPGRPDAPTVARIEVYPEARTFVRGSARQIAVTAHYTDGTTEDVTRLAQYQSNEPEVAAVAEGGKVEARDLAGQAAIMARYQGQVAVFQATVPLGEPAPAGIASTFQPSGFIDELAAQQWRALGLVPSETCTDAEFLRRASLDICGTLPTAEEVRAFAADTDPEKRAKLVGRLLDRPEYAAFFATKWADILRNKREGQAGLQKGTYRFHAWIKTQLARNVPYDKIVRGVLAASGSPETSPPVMWYRKLRTPDAFVDDTAQVFLGMRLQCAKCHHHPFEVWSQDDYYGFAAFFARIGRKGLPPGAQPGTAPEVIFASRSGSVTHPKSGKVMEPKGLGGAVVAVPPADDPRQKLVDWMADPKNPFFARALVNRYWAHFFGRGLVEPLDDLRVTNPPTNPELLDALADDFIRGGYDLKRLVRTICTSRLYGLASEPNATNAKDKQGFARRYPKRLPAEVLLDAIAQVTGAPTPFAGLPAGTRAIDLPDEAIGSTFLDAFGRPKRDTPCECERVTDASLSQSLMLLNSAEVQGKLSAPTGRAALLAQDPRPDAEKVPDLFWAAFARPPSTAELARALEHLEVHKDKKAQAYEDILWALVNAKEFQFND